MINYLCLVAMFVDMIAAWYQWKKKDICGVVFWCTLVLVMAMAVKS
jgi:hypothetical protein